MKNNIIEYKKQ